MKRTFPLLTVLLLIPLGAVEAAESSQPQASASPPRIEIRRFLPDQPISRALRPASVSADVINLGDADADVTATLLLPPGVRVLGTNAGRGIRLASSDGEERLTWELEARAALSGEVRLELAVRGETVARHSLAMQFLAAVERRRLPYLPEPKAVATEMLVGAHHCPLWESNRPNMWLNVLKHPERTPALGFYSQEDPEVADWETKWAVEHGVTFFIYCWYRTSQGGSVKTQFGSAIHDALFKSRFADKMRFTIMWENQARGKAGVADERDLFTNLLPYWLENYFKHPSYLKVDNKPLLFIYRPEFLVQDLGGVTNVAKAFERMRQVCREAGFDGLHLLGEYRGTDPKHLTLMKSLGLDYTFAYCWYVPDNPTPERAIRTQLEYIRKTQELNILPQVVTVSQAWSGWADEGTIWKIPPADFERLLRQAKDFTTTLPKDQLGSRLLLLDNWNEWGEGHYIAPYWEYGFGYLDAVRNVFSTAPREHEDLLPEDIGKGPYDTAIRGHFERERQHRRLLTRKVVKPGAPDGLAAWWTFDEETESPVVLDVSGHRLGGSLRQAQRAAGFEGNALVCNGGSVVVPNDPQLSALKALTIECRVRTDLAGQDNKWMLNRVFGDSPSSGFRLGVLRGQPCFHVPLTNWSHHLVASEPLPTGRWVHLAATFDGKLMRLYLNGLECGTMERPGEVRPNSSPLVLGNYEVGHPAHFTGLLDDVRLYHRALTRAEIKEHAGVPERPSRGADGAELTMPQTEDYVLLWWADGPPYFLGSVASPPSETLCFQAGAWGLAFDTKRVSALRAGNLPAPLTIGQTTQPGRAALAELPPADWDCAVVAEGRRFRCLGRLETKDEFFHPVRFVESGRFFQRVAIEGLKFADSTGKEFACGARMEISAWPDRLALHLELEPKELPADGAVELRLGHRRASAKLATKTSLHLEALGGEATPRPVVEADPALSVEFDEALGCHTLALPERPWSNAKHTYYPEEHLDRLDRWRVTLRNDSDRAGIARLMFAQTNHLPITGFTPMLCDADGAPTGLPVQISKNWHRRPDKGTLPHEGPWFHGCAFVRLPPRSKRECVFQMVYARYGGICAASHAQLSLIGWGHNQFWDQAAIGSFGESICFEPGRVQRRCFIDDVRPLLTLPQGQPPKPWGWADNCGGGDFLMWQDPQGRYQPMRATRTEYRAYGPCLTEVRYTEESAGSEWAARMDVLLPRSDDYVRAFFRLRYDVRHPVRWKRLAFFQLGSDYYNEAPSRRIAVGDALGLGEEWEPKRANGVFDRGAVPLAGRHPWLSVHDLERSALQAGRAAASRGLIVRAWRATLGGKPAPQPYASFLCTEWGKGNHRTVVELAPPPDLTALLPGDFVEADLELVVFPADAAAYYGPDKSFRELLAREADTWRLVQREAAGNGFRLEARRGQIVNSYPMAIAVDAQQCAEVNWQGGLGCVPVTFTGLTGPRGYSLFLGDRRVNQAVHGNDFWQTDYDPGAKRWRMTFNVRLDAGPQATHTLQFMPEAHRTGGNP